jgi:hypothetical protein
MAPEQGRSRLRDTLATLQELVTSRNSLERVIMQFSLYEEARKRLPIEDVIEIMRKDITILRQIEVMCSAFLFKAVIRNRSCGSPMRWQRSSSKKI